MKKIVKTLLILFVLILGTILHVLTHQVGGWRAFIVSSGSMEPAISTGSLIITHYIHPLQLKRGDAITFIAPVRDHEFVTHRINQISQNNNLTVIKTKGDHNKNIDAWTLAGGGVIGKVSFVIPYLGYFFSFSQSKIGLILLVLIPSLSIVFSELAVVINLLKKNKSSQNMIQPSAILALIFILTIFSVSYSQAFLSDSVTMATNQFMVDIVTPFPTNTPAPSLVPSFTPTPQHCTIVITNNGAGSVNQANCTATSSKTIVDNTITNAVNSTTFITNTGGNSTHTNTGTINSVITNSVNSSSQSTTTNPSSTFPVTQVSQ